MMDVTMYEDVVKMNDNAAVVGKDGQLIQIEVPRPEYVPEPFSTQLRLCLKTLKPLCNFKFSDRA